MDGKPGRNDSLQNSPDVVVFKKMLAPVQTDLQEEPDFEDSDRTIKEGIAVYQCQDGRCRITGDHIYHFSCSVNRY